MEYEHEEWGSWKLDDGDIKIEWNEEGLFELEDLVYLLVTDGDVVYVGHAPSTLNVALHFGERLRSNDKRLYDFIRNYLATEGNEEVSIQVPTYKETGEHIRGIDRARDLIAQLKPDWNRGKPQ